MADIFISFATVDTDRARRVYEAFRARGLSVFWSNDIPVGADNYRRIIIEEIDAALVVVVVWTHNSVASGPVTQECHQARLDNKLFQIVLDDIRPIEFPMEAGYLAQKSLLVGWTGDRHYSEWEKLTNAIETRLTYEQSRSATEPGDPVATLRERADSGHAYAQYQLGVMYAGGNGVARDGAEAVRLLRLAADQGLADAQFLLGIAYQVVDLMGLPSDEREAVRLYKLAAAQGHARAQYDLALAYEEGKHGLPTDEREAVRLYKLAADQGLASAQGALANHYWVGACGLPKDEREAVRLYKLAADQGHARAENNLKRRQRDR